MRSLPWFSIRKNYESGPPITIEQLLTHTSAPRELTGVNWSDLTYLTVVKYGACCRPRKTVFPPETEWKYSNLAVSLAGEIRRQVSAEPWAQYVEQTDFARSVYSDRAH